MALLATQAVGLAGTTLTLAAATGGGDTFTPGDNVFLEVNNGSGAPITVTIDSKVLSNYGTDEDIIVSVAAGARVGIGPLPAQRFADPNTGLGNITYSGVTTLTVGMRKV